MGTSGVRIAVHFDVIRSNKKGRCLLQNITRIREHGPHWLHQGVALCVAVAYPRDVADG
jgi:hypothetical protein